jgi:hypothetical protein
MRNDAIRVPAERIEFTPRLDMGNEATIARKPFKLKGAAALIGVFETR